MLGDNMFRAKENAEKFEYTREAIRIKNIIEKSEGKLTKKVIDAYFKEGKNRENKIAKIKFQNHNLKSMIPLLYSQKVVRVRFIKKRMIYLKWMV